MKRFLLTLVLLLSGLSLAAQDKAPDYYGNYYYLKRRPDFHPEHDVRIGIGANPLNSYLTGWKTVRGCVDWDESYATLSGRYNENLIGVGPTYTFGALSAAYTYRPVRWLEVGATLVYVGEYSTRYYNIDKAKVSHDMVHDISIIPTVRFMYYSSGVVRLYSKVGFGIGIHVEKTEYSYGSGTDVVPAWEVCLFGISVGRRVFGYAEVLSFGATGLVSAGIGYRFK